ncbi:hypothetical protein PSI23_02115 [Xenorhabdus sp. XENO-10]|uniref:MFS transporter n=1 Tax=Xenorhabdus yunnanensis TaxID=3025878 RepID=A0ABT5LAS1_9GAMM|nr:hypothetical protein [Xenorhabdus yunnanensis]
MIFGSILLPASEQKQTKFIDGYSVLLSIQARLALETLAGAYAVADSLLGIERQLLVDAAKYSFTNAIYMTSWLTAILTGIVALVAWHLIRKSEKTNIV